MHWFRVQYINTVVGDDVSNSVQLLIYSKFTYIKTSGVARIFMGGGG
jgi:hypothetical protein